MLATIASHPPNTLITICIMNTFAVSVCPNDRGVPVNGSVSYSNNEEIDGGYRQGTEATVTCNPGFMGGGDIICQSNRDWSDELPSCQPEGNILF